jgi:hypothetical protein
MSELDLSEIRELLLGQLDSSGVLPLVSFLEEEDNEATLNQVGDQIASAIEIMLESPPPDAILISGQSSLIAKEILKRLSSYDNNQDNQERMRLIHIQEERIHNKFYLNDESLIKLGSILKSMDNLNNIVYLDDYSDSGSKLNKIQTGLQANTSEAQNIRCIAFAGPSRRFYPALDQLGPSLHKNPNTFTPSEQTHNAFKFIDKLERFVDELYKNDNTPCTSNYYPFFEQIIDLLVVKANQAMQRRGINFNYQLEESSISI